MDEIKLAIKKLRNNKAVGEDEISGEMLKTADEYTLQKLLQLMNDSWQIESPPQQWKDGVIFKLPKKGDLSDCNNWRGITLLSVPGKLFCSMILERLKTAIDERLRDEQAGFRPKRSCIDQILTLRIIIEESVEFQSNLIINFVDFQKAFDSIHRPTLWRLLEIYGFPPKYTNFIKAMYSDSRCCVRTESGNSGWFPVETGVKQGCVLSPMLFGIAIDWVMRKTTNDTHLGIKWKDKVLEDLDFADDIALLSSTHKDAQEKTNRLQMVADQTGLQINSAKTKILDLTSKPDDIKLNDQALEKVNNFTYLGSKMSTTGDTTPEISTRIALAANAFNRLSNIWKSKTLRKRTKLKIFNACVIPVLTYGCESWKSTITLDKKLDSFENKCLRRLLNLRWSDFKSNTQLRQETKQDYVSNFIRKRRWTYIGHALRMDQTRLPHQALFWAPEGKRKRGRPKETLRRTITKEGSSMGLSNIHDLHQVATNRQTWRAMTSALCATYSAKGKTN